MTGPVLAFSVTPQTLVIGALSGLTYAVLAAGLLLVYRATRVINFAHGEMGAFAAAVTGELVLNYHWNYLAALLVGLVVGVAVGALVDRLIIRRLSNSSRVVLLVATLGISQLMLLGQVLLPKVKRPGGYPVAFHHQVHLGGVTLRGEHLTILVTMPAAILALGWFLSRTRYGIAIRATADNPDAARLAAISTRRISTIVWVLAGLLSAFTFILNSPVRGVIVGLPSEALGPGLLLRALAAALIGRFESFPWTMAGGLGLGMVEAVLFANVSEPGSIDAVLFVVVLVLVLLRARSDGGDDEGAGWSASYRPSVRQPRTFGGANRARVPLIAAVSVLAAYLLPLVVSRPSRHYLFIQVVLYAVIGLSVVIVTGWAGQLSLCQFAFVGVGGVLTYTLVDHGMAFAAAVMFASVAGAVAALVVGAPALRVRGLFLGITTLGFGIAASSWLFPHGIFFHGQAVAIIPRGRWWIVNLNSQRTYYWMSLTVMLVIFAVVSHLRRTGVGRTVIAVRDNPFNAAGMTLSPTTAKLTAFAMSGAVAALGGGLLAGAQVQVSPAGYGPANSYAIVTMVIIGGVSSPLGAVLGAAYILGVPALLGNGQGVTLLTSSLGLLVLLLFRPGGLVQVLDSVRERLLATWGRPDETTPDPNPKAATVDLEGLARQEDQWSTRLMAPSARVAAPTAGPAPAPPLVVEGVVVRFGGLAAVDGAGIRADRGEVIGLIGTNGAGKSTLMNAISGFVPCDGGTIQLFGTDAAHLLPHERAAMGMGRVFQDARLFPDLTVHESIEVALEARERTELVPSLLALRPSRTAERRKTQAADELIDLLSLRAWRDTYVSDLSTGTRRVVEMACLLAVDASLLLLDEPTAGMAQRETEAFGPVMRRVQAELGATVVIIEHDMGVIMTLSDRIYCMEAGAVIAEGTPAEIRADPRVAVSYLGTQADGPTPSGKPREAVTGTHG